MDGAGLRRLPPVQRLLERPDTAALIEQFSRPAVVAALRTVLGQVRAELLQGADVPGDQDLLHRARHTLVAASQPVLRRVINATGIILHTNLGRAPMAAEVAAAVAEVASGYCNLEYDLEQGARGTRNQGIEPLLRELTGAEAALAVNNCAAAMLLALSALAGGGEVVVSRGELVEIGGGFRIPDVIRQGGARLVEVGTTNKTRISDYRDAITPATRVLLKVHQSNFQIVGFTETVEVAALAELARGTGLLVVDDLGSGTLSDLRRLGRPAETTVAESLAAGADVVAFSGDKLLGGPQAGLLAGRSKALDPLRRHPLLRALRLDKMTLVALEATLRLHRDRGAEAVPVLRMMAQTEATLRDRGERLAALLSADARLLPTTGFAGGGSLPGEGIASVGVALHRPEPPDRLAALLRAHRPAVVGRIVDGCVLLDMLTVSDTELPELAEAVRSVASHYS